MNCKFKALGLEEKKLRDKQKQIKQVYYLINIKKNVLCIST